MKTLTANRHARKRHYKRKLRYELLNGYKVDYLEQKKLLRKTKNLLYKKLVNKNTFHINTLGIKTLRMPF